ncbi:MAG: TrbC/VirB2 family protein [Desulfobacteraceae bacterium]|nr:TrbC/VirB2 family protein [Desulfobacteraceae bacterium]
MSIIKQKFHYFSLVLVLFLSNVGNGFGASTSDPFAGMTTRTKGLTDYLSGDVATALCVFVTVVAGIALMFNKLRMEWALRIMGGSMVICFATVLVEWLFGK